ncbi:MAG: hypothetical protein AUI33_04975 [Ignavibacteria bacterium 13_1_40CM_2_61_4]|nr:MAG: hypothetical protein AUI33_04975 [Ignavibacteria bacterium 13_1_40CM_2_61_4]
MVVSRGKIAEKFDCPRICAGDRELIEVPILRGLQLELRDLIRGWEIDVEDVLVVSRGSAEVDALAARGGEGDQERYKDNEVSTHLLCNSPIR